MDVLEQLREEVANMDSEVDFPKTQTEAEQFKCILERIESGIIWKSDLRRMNIWSIYPWLINKLIMLDIDVKIITNK